MVTLFKKVEVFEKLANYGSRRGFLKALAQDSVELFQKYYDNALAYLNQAKAELPEDQKSLFKNPENIEELENQVQKLLDIAKQTNNNPMQSWMLNAKSAIASAKQYFNGPKSVNHDSNSPESSSLEPISNTGSQTMGNENPELFQKVKEQISYMKALSERLQKESGVIRKGTLKQINDSVSVLLNALKNRNWGPIKNYIIGRKLIIDSLTEMYNDKLSYDDLAGLPALDYGRGIPESEY